MMLVHLKSFKEHPGAPFTFVLKMLNSYYWPYLLKLGRGVKFGKGNQTARSEHEGARRGREIFQQKNTCDR